MVHTISPEATASALEWRDVDLPVPELPEVVQLLTRRLKALDLGAGAGASALALAELGISTTAVDASHYQALRLRRLARSRQLPLHVVHCEPHLYPVRGTYDLVVVGDCFHAAPAEARAALVRRIQDRTRRGGFNMVVATEELHPSASPGGRPEEDSPGVDLFQLYAEWKVLVQQRYTVPLRPLGGGGDRVTCRVVAQKR